MKILFLCTGNSCRSQMAEGFLKKYKKDWDVKSAGILPQGLNPWAVKVMDEINIDISRQESKGVENFLDETFDYVITACDSSKESCPVFLGKTRHIHWNLIDPAATIGTLEEILSVFREARDEIQDRVFDFLESLDWLNKRTIEI